jgi:hypothetical protein
MPLAVAIFVKAAFSAWFKRTLSLISRFESSHRLVWPLGLFMFIVASFGHGVERVDVLHLRGAS